MAALFEDSVKATLESVRAMIAQASPPISVSEPTAKSQQKKSMLTFCNLSDCLPCRRFFIKSLPSSEVKRSTRSIWRERLRSRWTNVRDLPLPYKLPHLTYLNSIVQRPSLKVHSSTTSTDTSPPASQKLHTVRQAQYPTTHSTQIISDVLNTCSQCHPGNTW